MFNKNGFFYNPANIFNVQRNITERRGKKRKMSKKSSGGGREASKVKGKSTKMVFLCEFEK
jgi:hypothetical protein